jgi:hypothetical protein
MQHGATIFDPAAQGDSWTAVAGAPERCDPRNSTVQVVDETEADLRALVVADLGKLRGRRFSDDVLSWLHYKARSVPPVPRTVLISPEAAAQESSWPAIGRIRAVLEAGDDVSLWLNKSVRQRKHDHAADMMFNDWQIVHFHLGVAPRSGGVVPRTGPLLFAHITGEEAILIDVAPHGAWTQTALLETLLRTKPTAGYQHQGVTGQRLQDHEYRNLRDNRTNSAMEIGGKVLSPGMGIMSSGHALRISAYLMWFDRQVEYFKETLAADQVPDHLKHVIYGALGVPVRLGAWYRPEGLALIDKNRRGLVLHAMRPVE